MKLTAIIPTFNEEVFLPNCLKSVKFVDEIIVIDSGSSDKTLRIAQKANVRIIRQPWKGYKFVHDFGAKQASGDWLLYLDADERISKNLRIQIENTLENPNAVAYQMPRKNFFFGREMKHGGWAPDMVTRLMRKDALEGWVGQLHEYPKINGKVATLTGEIYHLTHRGIKWSLEKTMSYTHKFAQILYDSGHPQVTIKNFFGAMAREFYYRAIKHAGWKDGLIGWLEIIYQTFNAFLIQVWLWEMQQKNNQEKKYRLLDKKLARELE